MTTTQYIKALFSLLAGAICSIVAVILRVVSVPFIMGFAVFDTTADAAHNAAKSIMEQSNSNEK